MHTSSRFAHFGSIASIKPLESLTKKTVTTNWEERFEAATTQNGFSWEFQAMVDKRRCRPARERARIDDTAYVEENFGEMAFQEKDEKGNVFALITEQFKSLQKAEVREEDSPRPCQSRRV